METCINSEYGAAEVLALIDSETACFSCEESGLLPPCGKMLYHDLYAKGNKYYIIREAFYCCPLWDISCDASKAGSI